MNPVECNRDKKSIDIDAIGNGAFFAKDNARRILVAMTCLVLVACNDEGNFASFPGFKAYFEAHPPSSTLPTKQEQALLNIYKPRIYLANNQPGFLDFYSDYIAHGKLIVDGKEITGPIGRELLNQVKGNPGAEFIYTGAANQSTQPSVLAKVEYDTLQYQGQNWEMTFLCYNLVFAHSGLLAELSLLAKLGLGTVADLNDWHQLDHYVGLTVVLHQQEPVAYFLQQHNYQTTYVVSKQSDWPNDQRVKVDVALRSNELYPHSPRRLRHPGVSFVSEKSMEFIKTGRKKPLMAGWDVTHGQREQDYVLRYLPPNDAFYQFKGRLGESRHLPGRDGPPGADYVTLPGLMRWSYRLVSGYRPGTVKQEQGKLAALFDAENFQIKSSGIDAYKYDFIQAWQDEP